jgi:hypothetical protein
LLCRKQTKTNPIHSNHLKTLKLPILENIGEDWLLEQSGSESQSEAECEAATQRCMILTNSSKLMKNAEAIGNQQILTRRKSVEPSY